MAATTISDRREPHFSLKRRPFLSEVLSSTLSTFVVLGAYHTLPMSHRPPRFLSKVIVRNLPVNLDEAAFRELAGDISLRATDYFYYVPGKIRYALLCPPFDCRPCVEQF